MTGTRKALNQRRKVWNSKLKVNTSSEGRGQWYVAIKGSTNSNLIDHQLCTVQREKAETLLRSLIHSGKPYQLAIKTAAPSPIGNGKFRDEGVGDHALVPPTVT